MSDWRDNLIENDEKRGFGSPFSTGKPVGGTGSVSGGTDAIRYFFSGSYDRDEGNGKHTIWTDTTILVPHDTTWVVDDIRYGGTWPFAQKGSLRELLSH